MFVICHVLLKRGGDTVTLSTDMSYETALKFEANEEFVELSFPDGTAVHIDREGIESGLLRHPRDQFLLDTLAFNEPLRYVQMALQGNLKRWLTNSRQFPK